MLGHGDLDCSRELAVIAALLEVDSAVPVPQTRLRALVRQELQILLEGS